MSLCPHPSPYAHAPANACLRTVRTVRHLEAPSLLRHAVHIWLGRRRAAAQAGMMQRATWLCRLLPLPGRSSHTPDAAAAGAAAGSTPRTSAELSNAAPVSVEAAPAGADASCISSAAAATAARGAAPGARAGASAAQRWSSVPDVGAGLAHDGSPVVRPRTAPQQALSGGINTGSGLGPRAAGGGGSSARSGGLRLLSGVGRESLGGPSTPSATAADAALICVVMEVGAARGCGLRARAHGRAAPGWPPRAAAGTRVACSAA